MSTLALIHRHYRISGVGMEANSKTPVVLPSQHPPSNKVAAVAATILTTKDIKNPKPVTHKKLFKLTVPRPQYIYPVYSDLVEVVPDFNPASIKNKFLHHATGLRFFYLWDTKSEIELKIPSGKVCYITPPVFGDVPTVSDIEIRYQGLDLIDQNDPHSDARSCFASLATLVGSTCWLNYGDGKSSPTNPSPEPPDAGMTEDPCAGVGDPQMRLLLHTGGDCHAPVIVDGLDGV